MRFPWYRMFRAPNVYLSFIGMVIALICLALLLGWGIKPNLFGIDMIWFSIGFTVASLPFTAVQIFRGPRHVPPLTFPEPLEYCGAQAKARVLLDSFLTDKQRYDLERHGFFTHHGKNHLYQIHRGWSMNIRSYPKAALDVALYGDVDARAVMFHGEPPHCEMICAYPYSDNGTVMPPEDVMLAQLLWLRNDEKGFRRKANILR